MNPFAELTQILQSSVSPVIVISSVGLILLSMTNRYGRVIDRARSLGATIDRVPAPEAENIKRQIFLLYKRCRQLQLACSLASLSILFVSLTVVFLFIIQLFKVEIESLVMLSFILSLLSLITALILFIQDVAASLKALKLELHDHLRF